MQENSGVYRPQHYSSLGGPVGELGDTGSVEGITADKKDLRRRKTMWNGGRKIPSRINNDYNIT